jgi:tetratricopeptide (TPR) repeat protein
MRIWRRNPSLRTQNLAISLNRLSECLVALHRYDEALEVAEEAIQISRRLVRTNQYFLSTLGKNLITMGNLLSWLGQRQEALKATKEAVEIFRELAGSQPGMYNSFLAASLNKLSADYLKRFGHNKDAVETAKEAVAIYGSLVESHPQTFTPPLLRALSTLAAACARNGDEPKAVEARYRQLILLEPLVKQYPQQFARYCNAILEQYNEHCQMANTQPDVGLTERIRLAISKALPHEDNDKGFWA